MEVLSPIALFELKNVLKEISLEELAVNLLEQSDDRLMSILYEAMRDAFIEVYPQYQRATSFHGNRKGVQDGD